MKILKSPVLLLCVALGWPEMLSADEEPRRARSALEVAEALAENYGGEMKTVSYIPALSLWGRWRLADFQSDEQAGRVRAEVRALATACPEMNQPGSGPVVAGVLIQGVVGNRERLLRAVALGLDAEGRARGHVPGHGEMSDAVFMHCPLLAMAYVETGEKEYLEACRNHWRFMQKMCLRKDGLYRHSPLHEAAWGRGNGFPALGVSLVLQELERREESPQALREEFRAGVRAHLRALKRHQDEEGMWHQVIDHAESYAEFSATCMIGYALYAGLNGGWLAEEEFGASAAAAWEAVKGRIRLDGEFLEGVCTGTGKQKSLQAYFERKEIHGRDERGGAMALLLATERLRWEQGRGE